MASIPSLDRFRQPDFEQEVARCSRCDREIYAGQEAIECDGELFCDEGCFIPYAKDALDAQDVRAGDVVGR